MPDTSTVVHSFCVWHSFDLEMNYKFLDALEISPVIAAVKDDEGVDACLKSESQVVFILYGDICTIPEIVSKVKAAGKLAVVHLDLIHGLASKNIAADFIKKYTVVLLIYRRDIIAV